ncbi:fibronectin type III domain-containing protein [Phthorimaea operculella]|nr:fibronectin type III domain-containing protein [Phthorimaea operculella]
MTKPTWPWLQNIALADPEFNKSRPIDLLLGAKVYAKIILSGLIKPSDEKLPIAQQTQLGWLLCGDAGNNPTYQCNLVINNIEDIQQFWEVEDITEDGDLSSEEIHCVNYFNETTTRTNEGRYVVRLPMKPNFENKLGNTKQKALAQFLKLELKMEKDEQLATAYKSFINEYRVLQHMKPAKDNILRVGGRLEQAAIDPEMKHPKIIPGASRLAILLILQAHQTTFHGGPRLTLAYLRREYWITGGNNTIKKQLRKCVICRKQEGKTQHQIMGDLPAARKRGLINGIGNLANALFGTLDDKFAEQYEKDIALVRENEKHLALLWKNQTTVVEAEYNLLKRTEDSMQKQHKIVNQHLLKLEKVTSTMIKQVNEIELTSEFTLSSMAANNILTHLKNVQDTLLDMTTNVYNGKLNIHLIDPQQLKNQLSIISGQLNKEITLPIENLQSDMQNIYHLLKIKVRMTRNYYIFEIRIPLISPDNFDLYNIIPVPHPMGKYMITIIPIENDMAINLHKDSFIPVTQKDLNSCVPRDSTTYLCQLTTPIYKMKTDKDLCIKDEQQINQCKTSIAACQHKWTSLQKTNQYLYFCCNTCNVRSLCNDQVTTQQLTGSNIINLAEGCLVKTENFTIYTHKNLESNMEISYKLEAPVLAPINNVINVTIDEINIRNQTNIAKEQIFKEIDQKINAMKQDKALIDTISVHDIHHYSLIYGLWGVVIIGAAFFVCRWLHRRRGEPTATASSGVAEARPPFSLYLDFDLYSWESLLRMGEFVIRLKNATASPAPVHTALKSLASEYADFTNLVWQAVTKILEQTNWLSLGLERHEAFLRRKVLLFHGVAETKDERLAEIRVCAINANGSGPFSDWVTATTQHQELDETRVPAQPPPLTTRAGRDWISVWWSEEEGGGERGVLVRGYWLGWGLGVPDEHSKELPAAIHSHVIRGLESNAEYVISLRASNSLGLGPAVYATKAPPLIPPVGLKVIMLSGTTAVVYWTDPTLPKGQTATDGRRYVVRWSTAGGRVRTFNATDLNCMLDDLKPFTTYEFAVKLIKGGRESAWSMLVSNTTLETAPASPPRDLRAVPAAPAARAADLSWLPPAKPNGVITGYVIMYAVQRTGAAAGSEEWTAVAVVGEKGRARVDRLRPRTTYSFKVQARNSKGLGPFGPPITYTTAMEVGSGGGLASATSAWLWASAGGACAVLALAAALALSLCCRRSQLPLSPDTSTYQKSSASAAIKPPDLWIHHDQMELKHMDKSLHSSAISAGSVDGTNALVSSTLTLGRTPAAEYEPARHQNPPASLDRRHYVPTYVAMTGVGVGVGSMGNMGNMGTMGMGNMGSGMGMGGMGSNMGTMGSVGCANTCDRRQHRPMHPDQSTPLLAGVAPLSSPVSSLASLHPHHPPPAPCGSGTCPLGAACSAPTSTGTGSDIYACAARERGHYVAYEPLGHYTHRDSLSSEAGAPAPGASSSAGASVAGGSMAGGSLQRRHAPLHSFSDTSDHSTPSHSNRSVRESSPYKKSASSSPGHIPNRLQLGGSVAHCPSELEPLTPSRSTERLQREMQNLEGLMKDLSAITQQQFHC